MYCSPWDRHEPTYGDSPAYNRYFRAQLRELLTNYGDVAEVWFDGACAEGPNGKRQEQDPGSRERLAQAVETIWYPAEYDVSIRPGWFYHASQDLQVRSLDRML